MSSNFKRSLYEPVAQENAGNKPKRKTLSQGRLVAPPGEAASAASLSNSGRKIGGDGVVAGAKSKLSSRASVGSRHEVSVNSAHSLNHSRGPAEDPFSPRREMPSITEHDSPRQVKPSHSLDLSETDSISEIIISPKRGSLRHVRHLHQPDVQLVDASGGKSDLERSEVKVNVSMETSPAKIQCHPRPVGQMNIRESNDPEMARKISTDPVPRVILGDASDNMTSVDKHNHVADPGQHRFKSPLVVKESSIAGCERDLNCTAKPALILDEPPEPLEESGLGFKHPLYRALKQHRLKMGDSQGALQSFTSNSSLESLEFTHLSGHSENSAVHVEPNIKKTLHFGEDVKDKVKKKKKASRVIQSRFMQAAAAKSKGPMKATDRSVLQTSSSNKSKTTAQNTSTKSNTSSRAKSMTATPPVRGSGVSTGRSPLKSRKTAPVHSNSHKVNISQMSTTPEAKGQSHKASTPSAEDDKSFFADVSAIAPVGHIFKYPKCVSFLLEKKKKVSSDSSGSLLATSALQDTQDLQPKLTKKKKAKAVVSQRRLDIEYARYIQWLYLDAKLSKALKDQDKEAMAQMFALYEENQRLEQRKEDLNLNLAQLQYLNALDDTLDVQESGLHAVSQSLPGLEREHHILAQALDTTRHQIPTRDIHLPESDEDYRNLEMTLLETEQLMGELSVMLRQKQPKVNSFASTVHNLQETVQLEMGELARCRELVAACETLATEEGSLLVQDIQCR